MKKLILLACITALGLLGADATGTWTGTLTTSDPGEGQQARSAHLVLKQEGTKLTGTAGPSADQQHPIDNGKAEEGSITFDLPTGEATMKFTVKQDGDAIEGDVTREHNGEVQKAKLAVKRQK